MNQTYPQPAMGVICFSAHRIHELIITAAIVWYRTTLAFLTLYDEISAARTPEGFAAVRVKFQQEWVFNAGFVSRVFLFLDSPLVSYLIPSS